MTLVMKMVTRNLEKLFEIYTSMNIMHMSKL